MKSKKIIIQLSGGLGNQMFMYATARAFALRHGHQLYIDTETGFKNDVTYKRTFDLGNFRIKYNQASNIDSYKFKFGHIYQKICRRIGKHLLFPSKLYIKEFNHQFVPRLLKKSPFLSDVFLEGYWQKEYYFKEFEDIIRKDFILNKEISFKAKSYLNMIKDSSITPIAIGIRRYQEVTNSSLYQLENEHFYLKAINFLIERINNPLFFIFTQTPEWVKENITSKIKAQFCYISGNEAFEDLFLFSQCTNFIISNSTFYWWGAWLSTSPNKIVVTTNKFPSKDLCLKEWIQIE